MNPTNPQPSHERSLPGGIRKNITVIDKDHPLSELDPSLEVLLLNQGPVLLKRYQQLKGPSAPQVTKFDPLAFTTQVVAGVNYYVKLRPVFASASTSSQDQEVAHARIFYQAWTQTTEVTGFVVGMKITDPLNHDYPTLEPLPANHGANEKSDEHHRAKEAMADVAPKTMIRK